MPLCLQILFIVSFYMAIRWEGSWCKQANPWNVGPSNSKHLRLIGWLALRVRTRHSGTTCTGTESYSNWHVSHENLLKIMGESDFCCNTVKESNKAWGPRPFPPLSPQKHQNITLKGSCHAFSILLCFLIMVCIGVWGTDSVAWATREHLLT